VNRFQSLKTKLAGRREVLGTTIADVPWTGLVQGIASFPFDFLMFDLEHGSLDSERAGAALRVCRLTGLPGIVRVPDCVPHLISKTLDMGADGLLLPRVETREQVETAIRAARYFPRGRKGCGGFSNLRPDDRGSLEIYNENRLIFLQMESPEGLEILPGLLTDFGREIAGVIVGPYDASIMLGTPLSIQSPAVIDFMLRVFGVCAAVGIACGSFVDDASMIGRYRALGANIFWTGTELSLLFESYRRLCDAFAQSGGERG